MVLVKVIRANEALSDVYGENQVTKWGLKNYAQKNLRQRTVGQARSCTCCGCRSSSPPSSSSSQPSLNATLLFSGSYKYVEIIGFTSDVGFAVALQIFL